MRVLTLRKGYFEAACLFFRTRPAHLSCCQNLLGRKELESARLVRVWEPRVLVTIRRYTTRPGFGPAQTPTGNSSIPLDPSSDRIFGLVRCPLINIPRPCSSSVRIGRPHRQPETPLCAVTGYRSALWTDLSVPRVRAHIFCKGISWLNRFKYFTSTTTFVC